MRVLGTVALLAIFALLGPAAAKEPLGTPAHLRLSEGDVLVQVSGETVWTPAMPNLPLGPGDRVWVAGEGRAEVRTPGRSSVRLGDGTRLLLDTLPTAGVPSSRISLERGTVAVQLGRSEPQHTVKVELPQASLRALAPATFRSDLLPDGTIRIAVHAGEVIVDTPVDRLAVRGGQMARLQPGRLPRVYALDPPDEFDRWNERRDQQLALQPDGPDLPGEIAPDAPSLAAHGRWVSMPEHGQVWAPTVDPEWTPFRSGRWVTWRGEAVWVSDEPWGWMPYHYGRWLFSPTLGWVWVPPAPTAVDWHPGAVGWIVGPEFVAWCPLAPGEVVQITNIHITNIRLTNVFVNNAKRPHATVILHRDRFLSGRRAPAARAAPKDGLAAGGHVTESPRGLRPAKVTPVSADRVAGPAAPHATPGLVQPDARGRGLHLPPGSGSWGRAGWVQPFVSTPGNARAIRSPQPPSLRSAPQVGDGVPTLSGSPRSGTLSGPGSTRPR